MWLILQNIHYEKYKKIEIHGNKRIFELVNLNIDCGFAIRSANLVGTKLIIHIPWSGGGMSLRVGHILHIQFKLAFYLISIPRHALSVTGQGFIKKSYQSTCVLIISLRPHFSVNLGCVTPHMVQTKTHSGKMEQMGLHSAGLKEECIAVGISGAFTWDVGQVMEGEKKKHQFWLCNMCMLLREIWGSKH